MEIAHRMETHIIRVGHVGASVERGWVYSQDGVMGAVTATCYKGPPLILASTHSSIKLKHKESYDESDKK